eukprot:GEMP01002252.1.p1 GENE.GEMP01002252.1~~GEMP01002252.1.p1  ORF type:complete len:1279 (+),score=279.49 GEMP01002252.1:297-4133(+)
MEYPKKRDDDVIEAIMSPTPDCTEPSQFERMTGCAIRGYLAHLQHRGSRVVYNRRTGAELAWYEEMLRRIAGDNAKGVNNRLNWSNHDKLTAQKSKGGVMFMEHNDESGLALFRAQTSPHRDGTRILAFSAAFESGNLATATMDGASTYLLALENDTNTDGHKQWFYFAVRGGVRGQKVTFVMENFTKDSALYKKGMRPVTKSLKSKAGWVRGCTESSYIVSGDTDATESYRTLSFSYTFAHACDVVYFAYFYPYTYSKLRRFLTSLENNPLASQWLSRKTLCQTLHGLDCDILRITDPHADNIKGNIVLTARVHPGEANSSYVMEGFLRFVTGPTPQAAILRQRYIFHIVPMLNPDGVVHGNYRCSLSGEDLNRKFLHPNKNLHPTVWYLKDYMRDLMPKSSTPSSMRTGISAYIDMHGHSRCEGLFFYANHATSSCRRVASLCNDTANFPSEFPLRSTLSRVERNSIIRQLPWECAQASERYFDFASCTFRNEAWKRNTARAVIFRQFGVDRSYTVEASFFRALPMTAEARVDALWQRLRVLDDCGDVHQLPCAPTKGCGDAWFEEDATMGRVFTADTMEYCGEILGNALVRAMGLWQFVEKAHGTCNGKDGVQLWQGSGKSGEREVLFLEAEPPTEDAEGEKDGKKDDEDEDDGKDSDTSREGTREYKDTTELDAIHARLLSKIHRPATRSTTTTAKKTTFIETSARTCSTSSSGTSSVSATTKSMITSVPASSIATSRLPRAPSNAQIQIACCTSTKVGSSTTEPVSMSAWRRRTVRNSTQTSTAAVLPNASKDASRTAEDTRDPIWSRTTARSKFATTTASSAARTMTPFAPLRQPEMPLDSTIPPTIDGNYDGEPPHASTRCKRSKKIERDNTKTHYQSASLPIVTMLTVTDGSSTARCSLVSQNDDSPCNAATYKNEQEDTFISPRSKCSPITVATQLPTFARHAEKHACQMSPRKETKQDAEPYAIHAYTAQKADGQDSVLSPLPFLCQHLEHLRDSIVKLGDSAAPPLFAQPSLPQPQYFPRPGTNQRIAAAEATLAAAHIRSMRSPNVAARLDIGVVANVGAVANRTKLVASSSHLTRLRAVSIFRGFFPRPYYLCPEQTPALGVIENTAMHGTSQHKDRNHTTSRISNCALATTALTSTSFPMSPPEDDTAYGNNGAYDDEDKDFFRLAKKSVRHDADAKFYPSMPTRLAAMASEARPGLLRTRKNRLRVPPPTPEEDVEGTRRNVCSSLPCAVSSALSSANVNASGSSGARSGSHAPRQAQRTSSP